MKIVSWNCNGALRKKFTFIDELGADIYIIQECENPVLTKNNDYINWAKNHLWIGDNKNKGIGIFAKPEIQLELLDWPKEFNAHKKVAPHNVKYFLPCLVNESMQLLGVWTHKNNSPNFGYMGQFWKYLELNIDKFKEIVIAGDFNSNAIWDQWDRWWSHSDIVETLSSRNIESVYHNQFNEEQGKETRPTFRLQRKEEKPYHIDYFFCSNTIDIKEFEIGSFQKWISISDHVPLLCEI